MSDELYPIHCFHTGDQVGEGDSSVLREYYNALGLGEPFDEQGGIRYPEDPRRSMTAEAPQTAPRLKLVKS